MFEIEERYQKKVKAGMAKLFEEFDKDFDIKLNNLKNYFKGKRKDTNEHDQKTRYDV